MAYKCKYFRIEELVSKQVFDKYGQTAWQFFDEKLLINIDWLREELGLKITINNWLWGGKYSQRGYRCNLDQIVLDKTSQGKIYCTAHIGQGVDFDIEDMASKEFRIWIECNKYKIPHAIRIENNVSWNHMDIRDVGVKVYFFNA